MADSIIQICNRALSQIAETQQIETFQDTSLEAQQCGLWYDTMRARLLRAAPWGFARTQIGLTQLADLVPDNTSPYPFLWAYAYPQDCQKFRYLLPQPIPPAAGSDPPLTGVAFVGPSIGPNRNNRFLVHNMQLAGVTTKVILSNVPNAIGVYTKDEQDPDLFDSLFTGALESAISFKLVNPLSGNIAMMANFRAEAEDALLKARVADANEAIPSSDVKVDWIEARGRGYGWANQAFGSTGSVWGSWYSGWENMSWGM